MWSTSLTLQLVLSASIQALSTSFCNVDAPSQRCVPWINDPSVPGYFLNVTVNSIPLEYVAVDTGSTGFLISATSLGYKDDSDLKKCCEPAFEYLSSSQRYYKGYWLPSNLTFHSPSNTPIHSHVPILAVTERGKCTTFTDGTCTRTGIVTMPTGTKYMGIGFGRWSSEQPNATASTNPLLNIDFPPSSSLQSGYIINNQGLVLGVSDTDLSDPTWSLTQLPLNPHVIPGSTRPEWSGTPMCVSVADSACFPGTALFDTGVAQSYLGVPDSATEEYRIPKPKTKSSWILRDGTSVTVRVGEPPEFDSFSYGFVVGDGSGSGSGNGPDVTPTYVQLGKMHEDGAFVNTGRAFFRGFEVLFGEEEGVVGIRAVGCEDEVQGEGEMEDAREEL